MSLCPAPSTQRGSTARGHRSYIARPWEKSITSSSVPWITNTGEVTLDILSMLGDRKGKQCSVCGFNFHTFKESQLNYWYTPCLPLHALNGYKTLKMGTNDMEQSLLPKCMCKLQPCYHYAASSDGTRLKWAAVQIKFGT